MTLIANLKMVIHMRIPAFKLCDHAHIIKHKKKTCFRLPFHQRIFLTKILNRIYKPNFGSKGAAYV